MPAEFLRDVVEARPSQRRWSLVPLSIAAHAALGIAALIIPLAADSELPTPAPLPSRLNIMAARPMPPAPAAPDATRTSQPSTAVNHQAAPFEAPPSIAPEVPSAPLVEAPGGVPGGGIGVPGSIGELPDVKAWEPPPPAKAPTDTTPRRPGGVIREPQKVVHVAPVYPQIARSAGVEGIVILEAVIDERGVVDNVRVLRSHVLLEKAAVEAVRQWRYTPTLLNGVPVRVLLTITVNFMLQR